jgi:hypothetical protein
LVRRRLASARALLPKECLQYPEIDVGNLAAFDDYLEHNELGLALEELAGLGEGNPTPTEFWALLVEAAEAMNIKSSAAQYRARVSGS